MPDCFGIVPHYRYSTNKRTLGKFPTHISAWPRPVADLLESPSWITVLYRVGRVFLIYHWSTDYRTPHSEAQYHFTDIGRA
jgi:hypothetical protein